MHSFRPVFALPPCAPHPGHRFTPVPLANWTHLALVGCRVPASALQSTAAVHPTGTFLTGSDALAAKKWASACEQTAIRARSAPTGRISQHRDAANTHIYMHSLHINLLARSYRTIVETKHALAHFLAARRIQAYEIGGRRPPFSATTHATAAIVRRNLRVRCGNCACGAGQSTTLVLQLCTQRRLYAPKPPRTLWQSQSQH